MKSTKLTKHAFEFYYLIHFNLICFEEIFQITYFVNKPNFLKINKKKLIANENLSY
jgi:hypothetical protein